jgi:NhaP-type Na+/H+ or K+/H+ antiporter
MHNILLGQGLFCDMVSVLLVKTMTGMKEKSGNTTNGKYMGLFLLDAIYFSLGSFAIGFIFGFLGCLILKYYRGLTRASHIESVFILLVGYISYVTGDMAKVSGVVSIITTAVMFAMYGWYNLSEQG